MLNIVRMFVQKTSERAEEKIRISSERTMKSREENDM